MIFTGLIIAPFAILGDLDWEFGDDWDHHHRQTEIRWEWDSD